MIGIVPPAPLPALLSSAPFRLGVILQLLGIEIDKGGKVVPQLFAEEVEGDGDMFDALANARVVGNGFKTVEG